MLTLFKGCEKFLTLFKGYEKWIKGSEKFSGKYKGSENFRKTGKGSENFWKTGKGSENFRKTGKGSEKFWPLPGKPSDRVSGRKNDLPLNCLHLDMLNTYSNQTITASHTFFKDVLFTSDVRTNGSIDGVDVSKEYANTLLMEKPQSITGWLRWNIVFIFRNFNHSKKDLFSWI